MNVKFRIVPHNLHFRFEAGTSRGSFTEKPIWFVIAEDDKGRSGIGEASPLKGLSIDYSNDFQIILNSVLEVFSKLDLPEEPADLMPLINSQVSNELPSIQFAIETCLLDLIGGGHKNIFPGPFVHGQYRLPINGLIWMGDEEFMQSQIEEKLKAGFHTIKMKIGAIEIQKELGLLNKIRKRYSANEITLRVDANGAFDSSNVRDVLLELASLDVHSIEQPIAKGQQALMASLCEEGILPIALDEELIGVAHKNEKIELLRHIRPQFIILKPSLLGGIFHTQEWIEVAESLNIGWWMTSMLESNIGLNAIAQLTATYEPLLPQGLGTGQLYHNNWGSPLEIRKGSLLYNLPKPWASLGDLA